MRGWLRTLLVVTLFVALTIAMTYPLAWNAGSTVTDRGDPLLNTWILAWDVRQITSGRLLDLFDANIFYPHNRTLAYSEHLFPQSLLALPVLLATGNPILAYNLVLLFAFTTSGLGMYFLARRLTGSSAGAIVAGIVYAYSPHMFGHLPHMQVIFAGGIPLTFLFLHRFFATFRAGDLALFSLFFVIQALANGYYALFLSFFVAFFVLYHAVRDGRLHDRRLWARIALTAIAVAAVTAPFFAQYRTFQVETGFARRTSYSATLTSFLATSGENRLYGSVTRPFHAGERQLYPGAVAIALTAVGVLSCRKRRHELASETGAAGMLDRPLPALTLRRLLNGAMLLLALAVVVITVMGHIDTSLKIRAYDANRPITTMGTIYLIKLAIDAASRRRDKRLSRWREPAAAFYWLLGVIAFLFSFGGDGPYHLLHRFVPGFSGVRATARWHVFTMLAVAVFAAYGARGLTSRLGGWRRRAAVMSAPALILVEYASLPVSLDAVPVRDQVPVVCRWLAGRTAPRGAILELPLPRSDQRVCAVECRRVYLSAYHFRPMANGYSGYFPAVYEELRRRWEGMPLESNVADAETLGVRLLLVHHEGWRPGERERLTADAAALPARLRVVPTGDETVTVYEVLAVADSSPAAVETPPVLSRDGWRVTASANAGAAALAIDGDLSTPWHTRGPQRAGTWFSVDLGRVEHVLGLRLVHGDSRNDFPRGYRVEASRDGLVWTTVAEDRRPVLPITSYLRQRDPGADVRLEPVDARYLRITTLGSDKTYYWSIRELEVFGAG